MVTDYGASPALLTAGVVSGHCIECNIVVNIYDALLQSGRSCAHWRGRQDGYTGTYFAIQ